MSGGPPRHPWSAIRSGIALTVLSASAALAAVFISVWADDAGRRSAPPPVLAATDAPPGQRAAVDPDRPERTAPPDASPRPATAVPSTGPEPANGEPPTAPPATPGAPVAAASPPPTTPADDTPSDRQRMRLLTVIRGRINPKSVEASQTGLVFAQNNIFRHTVTVYDRDFRLVKTLRDSILLSEWGFPEFDAKVRGGPVEAAFTSDGRFAYVTQRAMYGPGFPRPGPLVEDCGPADRIDRSFVYEYDTATLERTRIMRVGSLPKDLAVTPDGRYLLVTNWCSYDLSIVDLATAEEIRRVPMGQYPRGIAVDPTSRTAYVAVIRGGGLAKVDLRTLERRGTITGIGLGPRDVLMAPDGRSLYVTVGEGFVAKVDRRTEQVVARARTGNEPRSAALSADGRSLYVVNWASGTANKIRTRDMKVLQTVETGFHPIGVTYDGPTRQIWISTYPGTIQVYQDE